MLFFCGSIVFRFHLQNKTFLLLLFGGKRFLVKGKNNNRFENIFCSKGFDHLFELFLKTLQKLCSIGIYSSGIHSITPMHGQKFHLKARSIRKLTQLRSKNYSQLNFYQPLSCSTIFYNKTCILFT